MIVHTQVHSTWFQGFVLACPRVKTTDAMMVIHLVLGHSL